METKFFQALDNLIGLLKVVPVPPELEDFINPADEIIEHLFGTDLYRTRVDIARYEKYSRD